MKNSPIDRRNFAKGIAAGALSSTASLTGAQEKVNPDNRPKPLPRIRSGDENKVFGTNERMHVRTSGSLKGDWFSEDPREIPLAGDYDVIVCGGGPAGFSSALAAARSGASTMLIEVNGCVGGIWTAGMLSWILDGVNKPGIMRELAARIESDSVGRRFKHAWVYHPEPMKLLLEEMLLEAGVRIHLHTRVVGAVPNENRRLSTVVTESKTGREVWTAKSFIDATGEQIGTREGRRIHGRYSVSDEDLKNGARFKDGICRVTFPIDVHATDPKKTREIEAKPFKSQPYDIPLRSLMTKDIDGLVLAGRCISGGFIAHSSYRVTGNAVAMGKTAGVTCAVAAREKVLPHEVPFESLGVKPL